MSCEKFQQDLSALLDGELDSRRKNILESHVRECAVCSHALDQMKAATERVRSFGASTVIEKTRVDAIKTHIASKSERGVQDRALGVWGRVPVFALLVLIALGMGNFAGRSLLDVLFPTSDDPLTEVLLMENGRSFGDVFMDLTETPASQRYDR